MHLLPAQLKALGKSLLARVPFTWYMDAEFRRFFRWLQKTQWLSLEELRRIQGEKLVSLMHHAYDKVPFYREVMQEKQLKPSDFSDLNALTQLPIIDKKFVKQHAHDLLALDWQAWKPTKARSGGTTGNPLELWVGRRAWNMEWAQHWRFFHWAGYHFDDLCLVVRPMPLLSAGVWYFSYRNKQLIYTGGALSTERILDIFDKMRETKARVLLTYPSVLRVLSRFALTNGLKPSTLRTIITASETFLPEDRALSQQVFRAPIYDWYGQGEHITMAAQCEHGNYHLSMEYSITETTTSCGEGYLIGTCLDNYAMPMIRYQTDDLVSEISSELCRCGRGLPYLRYIKGKQGDGIVTPSGAYISPSVLYQCVFDLPQVGGVQFIQEETDSLRVLIVPTESYTEREQRLLEQRLGAVFAGEKMFVAIQLVDAIEPTERGKHPLVVSRVQRDWKDRGGT
ncbi:MAG: hypothetical protein QXI19_01710 [Candidatus Caldarchaeum sp.]